MSRLFFILIFALFLEPAGVQAAALDNEAECKTISAAEISSCRCTGSYFQSKLGPEDGAIALHLVSRSYAAEPQVPAAGLYERFGAAKLSQVAQRILETHGEVAFYCPFSTYLPN